MNFLSKLNRFYSISCHSREEFSDEGGQAQVSNSYNLWPVHEPCGDFDNPGSSYERYADSYKPDWRRDQDTQAYAYVQSQEETLNDFIQSAQAFQQRSQANIQANIQANDQGWLQQDQMWQQQE